MKCNFIIIEGKYTCERCGRVVERPMHAQCRIKESVRAEPPLLERVWNFTKALTQHTLNGMPAATEEEIQSRLAICKNCPLFKKYTEDSGVCTHESCGCNISDMQKFLNKLAWKDQKCPIEKW